LTVGLWARGILQESTAYVPARCPGHIEPEGAGFEPPPDVRVKSARKTSKRCCRRRHRRADRANVPQSFQQHDARIRGFSPTAASKVVDYFRQTNIFPITHVVVMREALAAEHPSLAARLIDTFENAEQPAARPMPIPSAWRCRRPCWS
jgi:4,5-dihydroxyphthalate decarboxylase